MDTATADLESLTAQLAAVSSRAGAACTPVVRRRFSPLCRQLTKTQQPTLQNRDGLDLLTDQLLALTEKLREAHVVQATASTPLRNAASSTPPLAADRYRSRSPMVPDVNTPVSRRAPSPEDGEDMAEPHRALSVPVMDSGDAVLFGSKSVPVNGGKALTPVPKSPRSSRGGQARQGAAWDASSRSSGRSRTLPAKAMAFRNQRKEQLSISIHKVQKLESEPMSPKGAPAQKQVWGKKLQRPVSQASLFEDRSAEAIKERIEKKLRTMFGESEGEVNRGGPRTNLMRRYKSIE